MKQLITLLFSAISAATFAQAPQGVNYQAVIRDNVGAVLTNQAVGLKVAILQSSPSGSAVYEESFTPTTSQFGLVNVVIGQGTIISGDFATIDWSAGPYFAEISADETGGTSYSILGTQQLMSVPYALYAENSGTPGPQGATGPAGTNGTNGTNGESAYDTWITLGNTGTEADFINSLTGPQGPTGATGAIGPQGATGPAGTNGTNGTNGVSLNWLGTLATAPASPSINDAYYNSTVGISYIWNGSWNVIAQDGVSSSGSGSDANTLIYTVNGF
ncbi:MAG: hypothetical protein P8O07_00695 [Crocinitomicaceae bacterium]|nr:hypothetical protein [Crocinitomicaceae bacterium]